MIRERLKGAAIGIIAMIIIMTSIPVFATVAQRAATINYNNIKIVLNGKAVQTENEPFIFDSRTYLPVRDVAEALGLNVDWDDRTKTASLSGKNGKYQTEADFLNSVEGAAFQAVAYRAAKALLSADAKELAVYMADPAEAAKAVKGLANVYGSVEYLYLVWSLDSIKSDTQVNASYRYVLKGEDSYSYVSMELAKKDDVWKVRWLGIEK